jgi:glyoxylase-like metal-dependent hydrolase (beta-lactamase superfamily II)
VYPIVTIDCEYLGRPRFAAAYLLRDGDEAAFIDNNTNAAVPRLLAALAAAGMRPAQVRYLIVTHVHLDHAGGTSALARACPDATVVAHPRAAPHLVDPSKLVDSATTVYGADTFERLYGHIEPIAEARVVVMEDGDTLILGGRRLRFVHTRGHANHHFCIVDESSRSVFTGDAFGLHYPDLQRDGTFALPSTSPTDFDPALAADAVRRIEAQDPACVYPTHFGAVHDIGASAGQLLRHLDFAGQLLDEAAEGRLPDEAIADWCRPRIRDYLAGLLDARGDLGAAPATWELLGLDIDLNARGIAHAATRRRRKARENAR